MPQPLTHGKRSEYRGEAVCQFLATLTVGKSNFQTVDFRHFSLFLIIFRSICNIDTPASVQNRSELFAAKIRGPGWAEREVHMCETPPDRSLAGGAARGF